jgi:hypothetical protein
VLTMAGKAISLFKFALELLLPAKARHRRR